MNMKFSAESENQRAARIWSAKYLDGKNIQKSPKLLAWWYSIAAPPMPDDSASFAQRELARRGQLGSIILLFMTLAEAFVAIPVSLVIHNYSWTFVLLAVLLSTCLALILNRRGYTNFAGGLAVAAIDIGIGFSLLPGRGGLDANSLPMFDLLMFSELVAVSLLPARNVFAVAAFNSVFIIVDIAFQRHAPNLTAIMATTGGQVFARPIVLHFVVALVTFLWVTSATQALERADRAQVIAELQHSIAEREHATAQQKRILDASIQQIVDTLTQWSNGNAAARIPLTQQNSLWQVAGSINNLLNRVQHSRLESDLFQRTSEAITRFYESMNRAKGGAILNWTPTNTPIDALVKQYNTQIQPHRGQKNIPTGSIPGRNVLRQDIPSPSWHQSSPSPENRADWWRKPDQQEPRR